MNHSFDIGIAEKYGINAAVLLQNIFFWCQKNKANGHNFIDGKYWTYNSRNAFREIFPYFSERQIKTALDKLIDDGVIVTGCYNKDNRDRSLWYALTDKGWSILQKCGMQTAEMSNANCENVRPLPDINPDKKPDILPDGFEEFWDIYPRHLDKQKAIRAWKALRPDKDLIDNILDDVRKRNSVNWNVRSTDYVPYPTSYLNGRRWEDDPVSSFDSEPEVFERDLSVEEIMRRAEGLPPEGF